MRQSCRVPEVDDMDYQVPFKITGRLNKLALNIDRPKLTPEDIKKLEQARSVAAKVHE